MNGQFKVWTHNLVVINNQCLILTFDAVLDSWGRFPSSGILKGSFTSLGSYDQCLAISIPSGIFSSKARHDNRHQNEAQYCSIVFQPQLPPRPAYHNLLSPLSFFTNRR